MSTVGGNPIPGADYLATHTLRARTTENQCPQMISGGRGQLETANRARERGPDGSLARPGHSTQALNALDPPWQMRARSPRHAHIFSMHSRGQAAFLNPSSNIGKKGKKSLPSAFMRQQM